MTVVSVAVGGAIGAVLRYLLVLGAGRAFGPGFPLGVLSANVAGSIAMGVLAAVLGALGPSGARWAPFLMTGLLGGFTTFSAFALEATNLAEDGRLDLSALYVFLSVALSLIGLVLGLAIGRYFTSGIGA